MSFVHVIGPTNLNKARKADGFQPPLRLALCVKEARCQLGFTELAHMDYEGCKNELIQIVDRYLSTSPERDRLISVIEDSSRSGLPIRGVLESIRNTKDHPEISAADREIIEELLYLYG